MELQTFVEPILRSLSDFEVAALQVVVEALIGDFVPLDSSGLTVGNNIAVGSTDFLQGIAGSDEHIVKYRDTAGISDGVLIYRQSAIGGAIQMELHALDEAILRSLRDLQISTAQGVIERDGRGLAADDGDSLCRLRFILIIGLLSNGIGSGKQIQIDCTVLTGRNRLIDAIAGDIELNTLDFAVLAGFYNVANAIGLCVQFEVEVHRVFCAGGHRLLARAAPNEHLAHAKIGLLLRRDHHSVGNHVLAGEGVLVSAAGDSNAAGREVDIGQGVVGIGQGDAVVVIRLIVLHGVGLSIALIAGSKARHNVVLGHLLQNPVVALLCGSALDGVVIHIRINAVVGGNGGRARAELLLVLPDDALCCKCEVIIVRTGNRAAHALVIAVHQRHHNSVLCGDRQILKILAVLAAGGIVGVAVVEGYAALNAVHMMLIAVAVDHHILVLGIAGAIGLHIETAVIVVEDGSGGRFAVEHFSIRTDIMISIRGGTLRAFLDRPCKRRCRKHCDDHEDSEKCREQLRALGFGNTIHIDFSSFHFLIKKKPSAISAEDFVLVVVL